MSIVAYTSPLESVAVPRAMCVTSGLSMFSLWPWELFHCSKREAAVAPGMAWATFSHAQPNLGAAAWTLWRAVEPSTPVFAGEGGGVKNEVKGKGGGGGHNHAMRTFIEQPAYSHLSKACSAPACQAVGAFFGIRC
jgi:hypothetical protein